ncbi:response regulator transcription factor [Eubacterium oxidoreducens]|uniref:Stage 0 sporulation protein A homolog n=1 Tax=Eubacterium oxidoreducens TaxID=1732 RepID=A0A1G6A5W6_EUBOX|nr:response regulator transcription factor [Eubacterium oxidoreducens]SDB03700.1 DNA-binding response regulator, OmpR family, contains REC and winged-helix (wHTH) domain [Eubacterium oxidoreducens]
MHKILVVDDEKYIRESIREFAEFSGYEVQEAANGMDAINICKNQDFDVIIMDIMMPTIDGYLTYKEIKKMKDIPVLMLSAKGEEYDKLYGFELGVDDYVTKPFSLKELMARVAVIIRRNAPCELSCDSLGCIEEDGLTMHLASREVCLNGEPLFLRPKEYDLLLFFLQNKNIVFSRDELLNKVWGYDYGGDDRTVDSQVKMLRRALGDYRSHIITIRGVGYKFV